ncbi:hypothetical protein NL676_001270 [Syzygium grande]|nr:hypothetical protein NL676_001270 [Syzygium grande]
MITKFGSGPVGFLPTDLARFKASRVAGQVEKCIRCRIQWALLSPLHRSAHHWPSPGRPTKENPRPKFGRTGNLRHQPPKTSWAALPNCRSKQSFFRHDPRPRDDRGVADGVAAAASAISPSSARVMNRCGGGGLVAENPGGARDAAGRRRR